MLNLLNKLCQILDLLRGISNEIFNNKNSILTSTIHAKDWDEASQLVDDNKLDFVMQYDGTIDGNEEIQIDEELD